MRRNALTVAGWLKTEGSTVSTHCAQARSVGVMLCLSIISLCSSSCAHADSACNKGAEHAVNAFIRFNPIYAMYFGSLESYVAQHQEHFDADSPAVHCTFKLAQALQGTAMALFDPEDIERRQVIDSKLSEAGLSSRQPEMSASTQFALMGERMARLGRGLPDLAQGNIETLNTATSPMEEQIIFAEQLLVHMLQTPDMIQVLQIVEEDIRELAQLEYQMLLQAARQLD